MSECAKCHIAVHILDGHEFTEGEDMCLSCLSQEVVELREKLSQHPADPAWISVSERLPEPVYGVKDEPPNISDGVLCYWPVFADGDGMIEVCNYDHEDDRWNLVHKGFAQPDCEPTHWMPLPAPPLASPVPKEQK